MRRATTVKPWQAPSSLLKLNPQREPRMNAHEDNQFSLTFKGASGSGGEGLGSLTMSTLEIADLTGKRHDNVVRDTRVMLAELHGEDRLLSFEGTVSRPNPSGGAPIPSKCYDLPKRETLVLVSGYSIEMRARIIDRWMVLEEEVRQPRPAAIPTTAEAFAQAFRMLADTERTQAAQSKAIARIEEKVERVETAQTVLKARPSNAEAITHVRARIGRLHGLSAQVIDAVMRQTTYAPKPAGMVKNDHESADGATYAVYWQKDVTETFKRFVSECVQVTPTMFTHPFIEGRFRIVGRGGLS
ncbi:MAG: hypothetical protein B7Y95_22505 [Rhizobiales bacterium 32-66-11]|nr:MAG: hypothetical protein B7Y95_22505 [Rhizobiales bacterium 32-66-11]